MCGTKSLSWRTSASNAPASMPLAAQNRANVFHSPTRLARVRHASPSLGADHSAKASSSMSLSPRKEQSRAQAHA